LEVHLKKSLFILVGFILVLSFLLGACSQTATPTTSAPATTTTAPKTTAATTTASTTAATATTPAAEAAKYGGIYKQALSVAPSRPIGLPGEAAADSYTAASYAVETLIRVKKDGTIVPILATSWKIADDGKSITLGLRKGVKFHDGSDFNADVAKWNLDQQIAAKKTVDWKSVDVVDPYTIRINVVGYKNTLLTNLSGGITQQISKASFDKNGIEYTRWHPVGTGPFLFVEYQRDAKLTYKRNPSYWDTGKPYLDGLEFTVIADETVRKLAFLKGDIHQIAVAGLTAQELQKAGYAIATEGGGTFAMVPDSLNDKSPWSNVNVRLAASYSIDRETMNKALGYGFTNPAYQVYPGFAQTAIPNLDVHKYNTAKAKDLLTQAGYPTGFKTVMHVFVRVVPADYAVAVANYMRAVGIDVTVDSPEGGKYDDLRYKGWSDGLLNHALASYENYSGIASYWLSGTMFPSVKKPAGFVEGCATMTASKEPDKNLIQAVVRLMHDDEMVIPYMEESRVTFFQKGVHNEGVTEYSMMSFISQTAWLEKSAR
jgi:peptide/nickel transport system substrate-binding protein